VLAEYLKSFHPGIIGLSGAPEQLAAITRQMMVYYARVPLPDGGYTMDHSALVIMADAGGVFRGTISHEDSEDVALAKLKKLLANP
jgi:protein SCO1/2